MLTTPIARQLDADFQEACQYFEGGRIGSAVDLYKSLYERGDYRGIEGLLKIRQMNPTWADYSSFIITEFEKPDRPTGITHRPIGMTMAIYPAGFSVSGLIDKMESEFGTSKNCRGVLDAMRTADWGHPYNAFEELVKAAGKSGKRDKRSALLKAIGQIMGMEENALKFFMLYK